MKVSVELQAKWANLAKIKQEVDAAFQGQTISGGKGKLSLADLMGANQSDAFKKLNPQLTQVFSAAATTGIKTGMTKGAQQAIPPIIQAFQFNWKSVLAGTISAFTNPYLSARAFLNGFGVGGGHGGGGGPASTPFGMGGGGNFLPVAIAFAGVKIAAEAVRMAFENMVEAFKRGSKLFTDAAKTGQKTGSLFQLQYALSSIGIDPSMANQLLLNAEFPRNRRSGGGNFARNSSASGSQTSITEFEGILLGARRGVNQIGDMQQLVNLSKQAREAWQDSAVDSRIAGETAKQLFNVTFEGARLEREWHALWTNFAADLSDTLIPVLHGISSILKIINESWGTVRQILGITISMLPGGGTIGAAIQAGGSRGGQDQFGRAMGFGGNQLAGHANQWQRMGFVMNGSGNFGPMEQIAKNTRDTVVSIGNIHNVPS